MSHPSSSRNQSSAVRALTLELKSLSDDPIEGIQTKLVDDSQIFEWEVALFGPPETLYQGGYFKARMNFPHDYPYSPPSLRFMSKMWHPNVYENGDLCISILHPPVDDPQSGELPCERWNPTQNIRTILLSVVSLLNEPNTNSPANVDASIMYRRWINSKGTDNEYENIVRKQVQTSRLEAEQDGVSVPMTTEEYCRLSRSADTQRDQLFDSDDGVIDDYYDDCDDDDDDDDLDCEYPSDEEEDDMHQDELQDSDYGDDGDQEEAQQKHQ